MEEQSTGDLYQRKTGQAVTWSDMSQLFLLPAGRSLALPLRFRRTGLFVPLYGTIRFLPAVEYLPSDRTVFRLALFRLVLFRLALFLLALFRLAGASGGLKVDGTGRLH